MKKYRIKNKKNTNLFLVSNKINIKDQNSLNVLGEKLMDLSNLIITGVVLSQLLPGFGFNLILFTTTSISAIIIYITAFYLSGKERS